jgi:hypothetical protein
MSPDPYQTPLDYQRTAKGSPSNVSRAVNIFRIAKQQKIRSLKRRLHACKD